jgi:hypothetical protein
MGDMAQPPMPGGVPPIPEGAPDASVLSGLMGGM